MSYQSLLQQHADQLSNHINAASALQQVAASQKAQGLAEKYNEIQEHYNAAVGGISTLSGAFHKGRKIYRGLQKQQALKADKAQATTTTPKSEDTPTASSGNNTLADPTARGEPLAEEPAVDPAANTNPNRLRGFRNLVNRGARQAPFQRRDAVQQADSDEFDARQQPLTPEQMKQYSVADNNPVRPTDADRLGEPETGSAQHAPPENRKLFSARNPQADDDFASTNPQDFGQTKPRSLGSSFTPKNAESTGTSAPKPASTPASTAGEEAGNVAKTAATTAGEEGAEVAGLSALDAIPVVGELVGAGLGLYSLFHGLSSEPDDAQEELTKTKTPSEGVAIDPSAVEGKV